ncbi:hypothetical protein Hanom_Chr08g00686931 [Helianthus anomalus]
MNPHSFQRKQQRRCVIPGSPSRGQDGLTHPEEVFHHPCMCGFLVVQDPCRDDPQSPCECLLL